MYLDVQGIAAHDSLCQESAVMGVPIDALRDLTAFAGLKPGGGILKRHLLQLKACVPRWEGVQMVSRRKRMGASSQKEHPADVDSNAP